MPVRTVLLLLLTILPAWAGPLQDAAAAGKLNVVTNLIVVHKLAVDGVSEDTGLTALCAAAMNGHLAICQYLVERGADVNFQQQKPAGPWQDLASGANGPLHLAADGNHVEVVRFLLERGARVNTAGYAGNTALHNAHSAAVAKLLLAKGASLKATNKQGFTPFQYAVASGATEVVPVLLAKGADADLPTANGEFPLMMAAAGGHLEIVEMLLAKGVKVDTMTEDGTTSLMKAAELGLTSMVELLLKRGADRNRKNRQGKTALDLARWKRQAEVVKVLSPR